MSVPLDRYLGVIEKTDPVPAHGRISQAIGLVLEGHTTGAAIGETCEIAFGDRPGLLPAEVVGFRGNHALLMPLGDLAGIGPGSPIVSRGAQATARVGDELLGRVIDGLGVPIDGLGPIRAHDTCPLYVAPPSPLDRHRITQALGVGIRAINGLLTCGKGQRIGIFSGSGVGKSQLLGQIARYTAADVNVIALIGERGREVKEFIEKALQADGLSHSVVVVATSDQPPLVRRRGAFLAMAIAEYFRSRNLNVLFMMDSLTRLAHAQREIGLAIGEPPTTKGYTPSVFALLPKFLERAGTSGDAGSITGLYTVLVEGDDMNDPIADAARATLDGHIVLSRELAAQNHFPAIDILSSTSRVMIDVVPADHLEVSRDFSDLLSAYKKAEDLIHIGAYKPGSDPTIDRAIVKWQAMQAYLRQGLNERVDLKESISALFRLLESSP